MDMQISSAKLAHIRQKLMMMAILFANITTLPAQTTGPHAYGIKAVETPAAYLAAVKADSDQAMIELHDLDPTIVYEIGYASTHNFTGQPLYPTDTKVTFMRRPAAMALMEVQKELKTKGLGLKIWDAYRPYSVTVAFWERVHDERYVADPHKGSYHNRGTAADLTIIELATGKELKMPTGWDTMNDSAHQGNMNLPKDMIDNRELLRSVMERHGFELFQTEWWHFNWPHPEHYDVLDIDFKTLSKLVRHPGGKSVH
jgi:D-alanyl-D-alanine dipeptidase